jgi:hypothetical protein
MFFPMGGGDLYIIITIVVFFDIIHRSVFYLKRNVSETGFCLRLQG